jgi:hypothetical protein
MEDVRGEKCTQNLVWKPEWNGPLGTHRPRWEDEMGMGLREKIE